MGNCIEVPNYTSICTVVGTVLFTGLADDNFFINHVIIFLPLFPIWVKQKSLVVEDNGWGDIGAHISRVFNMFAARPLGGNGQRISVLVSKTACSLSSVDYIYHEIPESDSIIYIVHL